MEQNSTECAYEINDTLDIDKERPLPVGLTEFNLFANRIISLAGSYADEDSMKFALASIIIHADASKANYSDNYFLQRLRKSAANQVASQVFQDIKLKQTKAQEAAEKAKLVEVTTPETTTNAKGQE